MTGFGYSEFQDQQLRITTEIKSYNNRYLDVFVNLPPFLSPMEPLVREFISGRVERGRVEINIKIRELQDEMVVLLDEEVVRTYADVLKRAAEIAGVERERFLPSLIEMEGVIKLDKNRDIDTYWKKIEPELETAFSRFEETRTREGENTRSDIESYIDLIAFRVNEISGYSEELEERIRKNLTERFEELVSGQFDENRILSETAVMLMKMGINEELSRLQGHIESFYSILGEEGTKGKKLDFICQELNREINTIGSKNSILEVSRLIVHVKDSIENIREQVRNVE